MLGSRTVTSFPSRASPPPSGPHPREIPASCTPPAAGSQPWSKSNPAAHDMPAAARRVLICQVPGPCGKGFWPRSSEADSTSQPKPGGQGRLPCGAGLSLPASRTASATWASLSRPRPSQQEWAKLGEPGGQTPARTDSPRGPRLAGADPPLPVASDYRRQASPTTLDPPELSASLHILYIFFHFLQSLVQLTSHSNYYC